MGTTLIKLKEFINGDYTNIATANIEEREPATLLTNAPTFGATNTTVPLLFTRWGEHRDIVNAVVKLTTPIEGEVPQLLVTTPSLQKRFGTLGNTYTVATTSRLANIRTNNITYNLLGNTESVNINMGYLIHDLGEIQQASTITLASDSTGVYNKVTLLDGANVTIETFNLDSINDNYVLIKCKGGYTYNITFIGILNIPINGTLSLKGNPDSAFTYYECSLIVADTELIITYKKLGDMM